MATSHWHKLYSSNVAAPPAVLFELLSDMPNYGRWLPGSGQFAETTDVDPYSFEPQDSGTRVNRWLVLDINMPMLLLPLRQLIVRSFDTENLRTIAAVKKYAEAHPDGIPSIQPAS